MNEKIGKLGKSSYPLKRLFAKLCVSISKSDFVSSSLRVKLLRMAGIKIGSRCFIGADVSFDGIRPDLIEIGEHVTITSGTKIITHFFNPDNNGMYLGKVRVADNAFIGMNSLIINSIDIGGGAVLAAGSVVTRDIPEWEIWGGNPAKFIRKRNRPHRTH